MAEVVFDRITKRFGDVVAVDALSLDVRDGEFMVLLGPSGCGKTTALRLIAGLESVSDGHLRIGEHEVNDVDPKARDVSMVFQSYALYPHMSVARNIESPLIARKFTVDGESVPRKLTRAERDQRVKEAATRLGLDDLLDRKPAALSGGQRQRVALARAIVSRPSAFLMDEPLSNLDAKLRAQTRLELVELHRQLGTTFVYVTHDQVEAMTMADRIAVMEGGRLQQVGPPHEVYARPRNLFVARFLGSPPMNTVPVTVTHDGWGHAFAAVSGHGQLALGLVDDLPPSGTDVILGVRPEHLLLEPAPAVEPAEAAEPAATDAPSEPATETADPTDGTDMTAMETAEPAMAGVPGPAPAAAATAEAGDPYGSGGPTVTEPTGPTGAADTGGGTGPAADTEAAAGADGEPDGTAIADAAELADPDADPDLAGTETAGADGESLAPVAPAGPEPLVATVAALEWLGHEQLVICALGEHRLVARQPADGPAFTLGATVRLRVRSADDLHLFDPTTTERIG
jgi:multiple sugar transport system ATP-binding protein